MKQPIYSIMGVTGQVGGVVARTLLAAGQSVRAVVRDAAKGEAWQEQGCAVALADIADAVALAKAFEGADAVFILVPPVFDPLPEFPEAHATAVILRSALLAALPSRVVYLSTIGAQAAEPNLLTQHSLIEQVLGDLPLPVTFLRPAWFMENALWDVTPAREQGVIPSFLQPLDKPVPMVATADIGRIAAGLLQETWTGRRVVELEAAERITPHQMAATFARLLGCPVHAEAVPRDTWEGLFQSQGMQHPQPRIRMIDGFNEGWIEFEQGRAGSQKGTVTLETVLQSLLQRKA